MTITRTDTPTLRSDTNLLLGGFGSFLSRLVNRWIANIIARSEREAARAALCQLDDRDLKDIGIHRHQLGEAFTEIVSERTRLQQPRQFG